MNRHSDQEAHDDTGIFHTGGDAARTAIRRIGLATFALVAAVATLVGAPDRTEASLQPNDPVWRSQVIVTTGTHPGAGSSDTVRASLNQLGSTWMDSSRNDFESGANFETFDVELRPTGGRTAPTMADIQFLDLYHEGDPWCIFAVGLVLNNDHLAFTRTYDDQPFGCFWLGTGSVRLVDNSLTNAVPHLTFSREQLEANPLYFYGGHSASSAPLSRTIDRSEMVQRMEDWIGDALHRQDQIEFPTVEYNHFRGTNLRWGYAHGDPVEIYGTRVNGSNPWIIFDLDLKDTLDDGDDVAVDMKVGVDFSCVGGQVSMTVRYIERGSVTDTSAYTNLPRVFSGFDTRALTLITHPNLVMARPFSHPNVLCTSLAVQPDGSLVVNTLRLCGGVLNCGTLGIQPKPPL